MASRLDATLMNLIIGGQCAVMFGAATFGLLVAESWSEQNAFAMVLLVTTQVIAALEGSTTRTVTRAFRGRLL
jgi:hypothetical protein